MCVFCKYTQRAISANVDRKKIIVKISNSALMTILYPSCKTDVNFEVCIGTIAIWWDLILFGNLNNF